MNVLCGWAMASPPGSIYLQTPLFPDQNFLFLKTFCSPIVGLISNGIRIPARSLTAHVTG